MLRGIAVLALLSVHGDLSLLARPAPSDWPSGLHCSGLVLLAVSPVGLTSSSHTTRCCRRGLARSLGRGSRRAGRRTYAFGARRSAGARSRSSSPMETSRKARHFGWDSWFLAIRPTAPVPAERIVLQAASRRQAPTGAGIATLVTNAVPIEQAPCSSANRCRRARGDSCRSPRSPRSSPVPRSSDAQLRQVPARRPRRRAHARRHRIPDPKQRQRAHGACTHCAGGLPFHMVPLLLTAAR